MEISYKPAITPQKYTMSTLHHLCTNSSGRPNKSWNTRLPTRCIHLQTTTIHYNFTQSNMSQAFSQKYVMHIFTSEEVKCSKFLDDF